jgi:hypothetical protein
MEHQMDNIENVLDSARVAAFEAASKSFVNDLGSVDRPMCGYAWVEVYGVRINSKVGKSLVKYGFKKSYSSKGLILWNPSGLPIQNMDVKEVGSYAYASVLRESGLDAVSASRLD